MPFEKLITLKRCTRYSWSRKMPAVSCGAANSTCFHKVLNKPTCCDSSCCLSSSLGALSSMGISIAARYSARPSSCHCWCNKCAVLSRDSESRSLPRSSLELYCNERAAASCKDRCSTINCNFWRRCSILVNRARCQWLPSMRSIAVMRISKNLSCSAKSAAAPGNC